MSLLSTLYTTVLDALFPLSEAEKELFSYTKEQVLDILPKSPETPIPDTFSIFAYKDERVSKLVWNIKYKKSKKAVAIGALALYKKVLEMNLPEGTVVIPTPITKRRRNERGYNQCELLLDEMSRLDVEKKFLFSKDLLVRVHHVSRQTLKGREERLESAKGVFAVNQGRTGDLVGRNVVIIDDVITTGSTMSEALRVVNNCQCKSVTGLSLAH